MLGNRKIYYRGENKFRFLSFGWLDGFSNRFPFAWSVIVLFGRSCYLLDGEHDEDEPNWSLIETIRKS